jgi:hypothetical protein
MSEYAKNVKVLEGPWERSVFPDGQELREGLINRKIVTLYQKDGYLCEETVTREYRGDDYFDTTSTKRIIKLDNNQ